MTKTHLSVVIPTYKRPDLLIKCLHALNRQTLRKAYYDIIVVSDGYDPLTKKLVNAMTYLFNDRLVYLYTTVKKGPAAARNMGWLFSNSDLIAFTDDDCIPHEHWLQEILNAYKDEEIIAYSGSVVVPTSKRPTDYEKNMAQLQNAEFITANCACTKKALYAVGGFDERFKMAWREDSDLHFKLLQKHIPIIKLDEAVIIHPLRKAKWGISIKEQKKGIYNALLYKKFPNLYRAKITHKTSFLYCTLFFLLIMMPLFLLGGLSKLFIVSALIWCILTLYFVFMRLKGASKSLSHISEMVITSIFIPYVSIYWRIYGSIKYKVLLV